MVRIQLLTEDLEKETAFNKTARDEIQNNKTLIEKLQEQLTIKTDQLESLRQERQQIKKELTELRQEQATLQRTSMNAGSMEKKLREANNKIESLSAQVKEQITSLKNAHQTINFLRAQKASRSYQVPGLDGPGHDVLSSPQPPKNMPK